MHLSRCVFWGLLTSRVLAHGVAMADDAELLEAAARRYRIQAYDSFRANRPELDRRLAVARVLLDGWRSRGAPSQDVPQLVAWFQRATWSSRAFPQHPLPAYERRPAQVASPGPSAPVAASDSRDEANAVEDPRWNPPGYRVQPRTTPAVKGSTSPQLAAPPSTGAHPSPSDSPEVARRRPQTQNLPVEPPDTLIPSQPPDVAQGDPVDHLPAIRVRTTKARDEFVGPHSFSPAPATQVESQATAVQVPADPQPVDIDLVVLDAKIRSINLSFKAVESELAENHEWSVQGLEDLATELSELFDAASLVRIYYEAITPEQRKLLEPILDVGPIQALFAQRAFEVRIRLTNEALNASPAAVADQLTRLETLTLVITRWNGE